MPEVFRRTINWLHAKGKCITENQNMIFGVSLDVTQRVNMKQEPGKEQADTICATASAKALLLPRLSNREQEVIDAILAGNVSYRDLSDVLCISRNTVKTHLRNIYQITGVPNLPALLTLLHSTNNR